MHSISHFLTVKPVTGKEKQFCAFKVIFHSTADRERVINSCNSAVLPEKNIRFLQWLQRNEVEKVKALHMCSQTLSITTMH